MSLRPRHGAYSILASVAFVLFLSLFTAQVQAANFPVQLSSDHRYLVDQNKQPIFLTGDDSWSLVNQISDADVVTYLNDRAAKGYNALWIGTADNTYQTTPSEDFYGNVPFNGPDFTNENATYWSRVDTIVNEANTLGITMLMSPAFVGLNSSRGYLNSYVTSSDSVIAAYGTFLGNRYRNFPNIIWVLGGDADPANTILYGKLQVLGAAIKAADPNHLITLEASRFSSAGTVLNGGYSSIDVENKLYSALPSWLDINWVYLPPANIPTSVTLQYNKSPFLPPLMGEAWYENENGMTVFTLRQEAYGAVLGGAYTGYIFGNNPIWPFGASLSAVSSAGTWQQNLSSTGSLQQKYVGQLFRSRESWKLVPDSAGSVLTAGIVSGGQTAVTARTSDGQTILSYIPTKRSVTIDMTRITDTSSLAKAWWWNPQTGTSTLIASTIPTTGSHTFTPVDASDYVLVIDSASANLSAPGVGTAFIPVDKTAPSVPQSLAATATTSATINLTWASSTDDVAVTGYKIFRNGAQVGTSTLAQYSDTGLSAATPYTYTVSAFDAAGNVSAQSNALGVSTSPAPIQDITPPVISSIATSTVTGSTATITWITNEPSSSNINYGSTGGYGSFLSDPALTQNHSLVLNGLVRKTTYHFQVASTDNAGNAATSPDVSFTTASHAIKPPTVLNFSATSGSNTLSWTNPVYEFLSSTVITRREDFYSKTSDPAVTQVTLSPGITSWVDPTVQSGTTYYYAIFTVDDLGAVSDPANFTFNSAPAPLGAAAGGGGGGGPASSPATVATILVPTPPSSPLAPLSVSAPTILTLALHVGMTDPQVILLQKFLIRKGYLNAALTGYFGPLTEKAVMAYQTDMNISATGTVGPLTRAAINNDSSGTKISLVPPSTVSTNGDSGANSGSALSKVKGTTQAASLDAAIAALLPGNTNPSSDTASTGNVSTPTIHLTKPLYGGMKDPEVTMLQTFLNTKGYLTVAPTGYFGAATKKAVIAFQTDNEITGTGTVGPLTRAAVNEAANQ